MRDEDDVPHVLKLFTCDGIRRWSSGSLAVTNRVPRNDVAVVDVLQLTTACDRNGSDPAVCKWETEGIFHFILRRLGFLRASKAKDAGDGGMPLDYGVRRHAIFRLSSGRSPETRDDEAAMCLRGVDKRARPDETCYPRPPAYLFHLPIAEPSPGKMTGREAMVFQNNDAKNRIELRDEYDARGKRRQQQGRPLRHVHAARWRRWPNLRTSPDRSIDSSDGRYVQRVGTWSTRAVDPRLPEIPCSRGWLQAPIPIIGGSQEFQLCNITPPGTELWFPAGYPPGHGSVRRWIAGRHRLRSELRQYLIVFEPPTFALDRGKRACHTPSLQFVLRRSKNFTSNVAIRVAPTAPFDHYLAVDGDRQT
ncbi:unnamed protein product [Acanthosepion pharaonis]|uniref:Uncharacterized protein n=1 Tax=Acanthosepion pharaonis TaxID=158019 RepID=A0A812E956_ACAPH|nr:unnamed protein product [Sepia pharaonis]